jgi:hypothetical protein
MVLDTTSRILQKSATVNSINNTTPCPENSRRSVIYCQFLSFFHSLFILLSVTQLPIHDATNEWIPTKIQKDVAFSNMTLGANQA